MPKRKDVLKTQLIDGLNQDLNLELEAVLRYLISFFVSHGAARARVTGGAKFGYPRRAEPCGLSGGQDHGPRGEVKIKPSMPKKLRTAKQMMQLDIEAERRVIANYTQRIAQAEAFGDKGLAIRLEDLLAEETDHAENLERLGR